MRALAAGLIAITCAVSTARAERPAYDPACEIEATELRAHLADAQSGIDNWNLGWRLGFGASAAAQFGLALTHTKPFGTFDRNYEETLYVGGTKAAIGFVARFVLPLRAEQPARLGDPCADRDRLRAALEDAGRRERRIFWMTHIGSFALNTAGMIVLGERRSWSVGAWSFALSYPIGLLSIYTMPRASWHAWRDRRASWSMAVTRREDGWSFAIAGGF
jgi:hypothetical protein